MDEDLLIRTEREQQTDPYPENMFTSCYYSYAKAIKQKKRYGKLHAWIQTHDIFYDRNLRPCSIIDRQMIEGKAIYTVAIRNRYGLRKDERVPNGELHIATLVPRSAIRFSTKIYTTDMHVSASFRHEIQLKDDVFPSQWKFTEDFD